MKVLKTMWRRKDQGSLVKNNPTRQTAMKATIVHFSLLIPILLTGCVAPVKIVRVTETGIPRSEYDPPRDGNVNRSYYDRGSNVDRNSGRPSGSDYGAQLTLQIPFKPRTPYNSRQRADSRYEPYFEQVGNSVFPPLVATSRAD